MRVYLKYPTADQVEPIPGPADLRWAYEGRTVLLVGTPTPEDHGRWATALGSAALRGATIQSGGTS